MASNKRHSKINLWSTHTSTILSIAMVLFVFGLLLIVEYHSYRTTHDMKEQITFKVDLMPDVTDSAAVALQKVVMEYPYVKHVDYISKEQAAELFAEDLGEDFIGFLGYNPLYPSLMVNFRADLLPENDTKVLDKFCEEMGQNESVTGVVYQENVVNELNEVFYKMSWFLIIFIVLLLLICILLINTTIRISLFAQRNTIQTMRLVGAKNSFIARPYVGRSILYGTLGGLIAILLIAVTAWVFNNQFGLRLLANEHWIWYGGIAVLLVLVGILISWISTSFSVRKHLRDN